MIKASARIDGFPRTAHTLLAWLSSRQSVAAESSGLVRLVRTLAYPTELIATAFPDVSEGVPGVCPNDSAGVYQAALRPSLVKVPGANDKIHFNGANRLTGSYQGPISQAVTLVAVCHRTVAQGGVTRLIIDSFNGLSDPSTRIAVAEYAGLGIIGISGNGYVNSNDVTTLGAGPTIIAWEMSPSPSLVVIGSDGTTNTYTVAGAPLNTASTMGGICLGSGGAGNPTDYFEGDFWDAFVFGGASTTIAAGSDGQSLPQATINLTSTSGFVVPEYYGLAGTVMINTTLGKQLVTYSGVNGNALTGCAGGAGAMATGNAVWQGGEISTGLFADLAVMLKAEHGIP